MLSIEKFYYIFMDIFFPECFIKLFLEEGEVKKRLPLYNESLNLTWQRPTLPRSLPRSTIGAKELNFRVRDGNGCDLFAITAENLIYDSNSHIGYIIEGSINGK